MFEFNIYTITMQLLSVIHMNCSVANTDSLNLILHFYNFPSKINGNWVNVSTYVTFNLNRLHKYFFVSKFST